MMGRSLKTRSGVAALTLACSLTMPQSAAAQENVERAAEVDRQARRAFEDGKFLEAARKFAEAFAISPHPATLFNEAMAWDQAGEQARAADAYLRTVGQSGLDDARDQVARERLEQLQNMLGQVVISGPANGTASVGHVRDAPLPLTIFLRSGEHEVRIKGTDNQVTTREVTVRAGQKVDLLLEVKTTTERVVIHPPPTLHADSSSGTSTWGWVGLGSAVALSGAAVYLGVETLGARDNFEASDRLDAEERDRALRYRTWTNLAWAAAALSGAVGLVLLLSDRSGKPRHAPATVRLTPTGAEATWRF